MSSNKSNKPAQWDVNPAFISPEWRWFWEGNTWALPLWESNRFGFLGNSPGGRRKVDAINGGVQIMDATTSGLGWETTATTDFLSVCPMDTLPQKAITIFFIRRRANTITGQRQEFGSSDSTVTENILTYLPWNDGVVYWDFGNFVSPGRLTWSGYSVTTNVEFWVFRAGPKGMQIWLNGELKASTATANPGRSPGTADTFRLGSGHSGFPVVGNRLFFAMMDYEVEDSLIRKWFADPWGPLRPEPFLRSLYPVAQPNAVKTKNYRKKPSPWSITNSMIDQKWNWFWDKTLAIPLWDGSISPQVFGSVGQSRKAVASGSPSIIHTPVGQAWNASTNTTYLDIGSSTFLPTNQATVLFVRRSLSDTVGSDSGVAFSPSANASPNLFNALVPWTDGDIYWEWATGSGTNRLIWTTYTLSTNLEVWVFRAGPKGMQIWLDGTLRQSSSTAVTTRTANTNNFWINNFGTSTGRPQEIYLFALSHNEWTDEQIRQISRDPFAPFRMEISDAGVFFPFIPSIGAVFNQSIIIA